MNRFKIVLGYFLGFIGAIVLTGLVSLLIVKVTVLDSSYVKRKLDNNNYYEKVSGEIKEKMENYMVSSGLPETILDDLYSNEEIREDVNLFIDSIYRGKSITTNIDKVRDRLNDNINNYINDHDVKVTSKSYIESFVNNMVKFYEQEINFYGMVNGYIGYVPKIESYVNMGLVVLLILFVILLVSLLLLKVKYIGSVISASGLIILFIRIIFNEKIDYHNILVISDNFSNVVKLFVNNVNYLALILSIFLILLGIGINLAFSLQSMPKKG